MRRRIRAIGEPPMPLPQTYTNGVVFIGRKPVGKPAKIIATGFLVVVPDWHGYIVTAAHVVEGVDDTFVRIRMEDGSFRDEPVPDWIPHGKHDVAVAPIDPPEGHDLIATGIDQFIDWPGAFEEFGEIELGDHVYFIGLLGKVKAMTERNVPIVRTGFLAALMQENIPVKRPREAIKLITAHLIDCRSFSGFSGSPAYIQKGRTRWVRGPEGVAGITQEYETHLLGLIGGHFDDWASTKTRTAMTEAEEDDADNDEAYEVTEDVKARVSTGIGYVIPAEFITETLLKKELVEMRQRKEAEQEAAEARTEAENAAEEDSIRLSDDAEFERFEDLARKLANTPKPKPEGDS